MARLAGVSPSVVSYVINSGPRPVSAEAKDKVMAAIAALNYRPNETARALARGSTRQVGLVVADTTSPFSAELGAAIEEHLLARGYGLVTANNHEGERPGNISPLEVVASRSVSAVIIDAPRVPEDVLIAHDHDVRLVSLNAQDAPSGLISSVVDYHEGAIAAVEHLIEHGRRAIGFVGSGSPADRRRPGWLRALAKAGLRPALDMDTGWQMEEGFRAGTQIVEQEFPPEELDALFIASDALAFGCMAALREGGYRIPEDIAIVSFDGTSLSRYASPALTTMQQPINEIAAAVVGLALDPDVAPGSHARHQVSLIRRGSCGCPFPEA